MLLLLPVTGEIGVEAAKAWRSKPYGEWELLAPEVIKEVSLLRFRLEHFCYFAGVVHDETTPPPPPRPPAADVMCGEWPLVESASRFSCCPSPYQRLFFFRTENGPYSAEVRLPRLSLEPNRLAAFVFSTWLRFLDVPPEGLYIEAVDPAGAPSGVRGLLILHVMERLEEKFGVAFSRFTARRRAPSSPEVEGCVCFCGHDRACGEESISSCLACAALSRAYM